MAGSGQEFDRDELLTRKEVSTQVRLCPRAITLYVKNGLFPQPACFKGRRAFWRRQDILNYLARLGQAASCTRGVRQRYRRTAAERRAALAGK